MNLVGTKRSIPVAVVALALLASTVASSASANAPVEAVGLFKERAMIRVMGVERYLVVGQTSPEGARLDAASADAAVVTYGGATYRLTLSDRVGGTFAELRDTSVSIMPDSLGQYRIGGAINGRAVDFLIDTGASVVAISSVLADRLGIAYRDSPDRAKVVTAQGEMQSYVVNLDSVNVAGLETHQVRAAVIPGSYPVEVLLGMSYLRKVSMEESAGVLRLKQKI